MHSWRSRLRDRTVLNGRRCPLRGASGGVKSSELSGKHALALPLLSHQAPP